MTIMDCDDYLRWLKLPESSPTREPGFKVKFLWGRIVQSAWHDRNNPAAIDFKIIIIYF